MITNSIHILHEGRALCGKPGVPGQWDDGHVWVSIRDCELASPAERCSRCYDTLAEGRPRPKALPRVVHTIEHMPECPVRRAPPASIPFEFGTVDKLAAAGCRCFVTFEVKL